MKSIEDVEPDSSDAADLQLMLASGRDTEIAGALGNIGRAGLHEHAALVASYLDHPSDIVRTKALEVLGKDFDDSTVAPLALARFASEADPLVRAAAIAVWARHHQGEREAVRFLFDVACDEREPESLRRLAWMSTFSTARAPVEQWLHRDRLKERAPLETVLEETRAILERAVGPIR